MSRQYFEDVPFGDVPIANLTAVTATTETILWNQQFTTVPANDARAGKVYRLTAGGILSTGASGTLIITPRWGNGITGTTLGASVTQTVPINLTAVPWFMTAIVTVRTVGAPGANSTVMLNGSFQSAGTAATAGNAFVLAFGGTSGTVDLSTTGTATTGGIVIGWTLSVAGSCTPQQVVWQSVN
jgi:hypothetical protein